MANQNTSIINSQNEFSAENANILPTPVFIHSSFRTSSTWLWSKIRKLPNVLAYYEVFHESLANVDAKSLNFNSHSSWSSGHPAQAPYFLEFLPFLKKGGGIELFDSNMSFERFIPEGGINGELSLQEISYLRLLIEQGYKSRKIPVLSETRTLGRIRSIKKSIPVNNVLVYRNIFDQWASYCGQSLKGNEYFISTILETVNTSSKNDKFISSLRDFFSDAQLSPKNESLFLLFVIMHIYLYSKCIDYSDLVIDTSAIASDDKLRNDAESELSKMLLSSIDLSDIEVNFGSSVILIKDKKKFIDTVDQFTKIIISSCDSQTSVDFSIKSRDDFISAWSYHSRVTCNTISFYEKELSGLEVHAEQKSFEFAHVVSERDQLTTDLAQTRAAAEQTAQALTAERDQLTTDLAQARAAAEQTAQALTAERDQLTTDLAQTRAAAEQTVQALTAERDQLTTDLAQTRAAAEQTAQALTAERDQLTTDLAQTRAAAEQTAQALTAERDQLTTDLAQARAAAEQTAQALTAERDQLTTDLAQARAAAEQTVQALTAERDQLTTDLAQTRAAAEQTAQALTAERDQLTTDLAQTRAAAEQTAQALTAERDQLTTDLAQARAAAEQTAQALTAERDQLTTDLAQARAAAEQTVQALTAERDQLTTDLAQARAAAEQTAQALTAERDQLTTDLAQARAAAEQTAQALTAERDQLTTDLAQARAAAEQTAQVLTAERDQLHAELVAAADNAKSSHGWSRFWGR